MKPTHLSGSLWLLCWAYGGTLGWKPYKCMKHRSKVCSDVFRVKHKWCGENAIVCGKQNKNVCKVKQIMQTVNCAPARRLKQCGRIALLSLRENTGIEWWQKSTKHGDQNIYIHSKTKMCEEAKTQLSVKTETNFLCSEAGNAISELFASQTTKKCVLHQVKQAVNGK